LPSIVSESAFPAPAAGPLAPRRRVAKKRIVGTLGKLCARPYNPARDMLNSLIS
jgi:hypothetical protein